MQLHIKYKDGTTRVVNLTDHFFAQKIIGTQSDPGIAKKAMDFAYSCGSEPYYIGVFRGNTTVFETHIRKNQPDELPVEPFMEVDETSIKKKLRRQFKNKPFKGKEVLQF